MGTEVRVPRLPESVTEAVVGDWHKKPGDRVQRDETLLDLETDKVVLDVPSPGTGILREVKKEKGATVGSEEVLGIIESAGEAEEETAQESSPKSPPSKQAPESKTQAAEKKKTRADFPETAPPSKEAEAEKIPPLSPAVRRLVREHRLDPQEIPATGRDGRLTKADVVQFLQAEEEPMAAPPPPSPAESRAPEEKPAPAPREEGYGIRREAMSPLRQRIAERMLESQQTTATLSTFNEVNMQGIMELRRRYRDAFEKRYGVRLGFMSFFIKACIEAFKRYPVVNAAVQDDDILYYHYYHIGIAVATPRGLVVPVLRDADQLSFADIEVQIMDFAERARNGRLTIEELSGGTFTITNGGVFGSLLSTPILNPPQSAILGMHKIEDRPVAENGEVKIRPMMYVALSYDHRLIDGKGAVQFLVAVKEALEDPVRLLLEV